MGSRFDLAVYSKDYRLMLVVEIVAGRQHSSANAGKFRRNLLDSGAIPSAPFLLLAYKDGLFLWRQTTPPDAPADFTADTKPLLHQYLRSLADDETIASRRQSIQVVIRSWLQNLTAGLPSPGIESQADRVMRESGLAEQILGGQVQIEALP